MPPVSGSAICFFYPPTRSTRVKIALSHLRDYHCYFIFSTLHEPRNFHEASSNPNWQRAMQDELDALDKTYMGHD